MTSGMMVFSEIIALNTDKYQIRYPPLKKKKRKKRKGKGNTKIVALFKWPIQFNSVYLFSSPKMTEIEYDTHLLLLPWFWYSSIASPVCQEGQSERNFPIFAFSSRFFLFFPDFFPPFPNFWQIFAVRGGTLPPLATPVAMPLFWYHKNSYFFLIIILKFHALIPKHLEENIKNVSSHGNSNRTL